MTVAAARKAAPAAQRKIVPSFNPDGSVMDLAAPGVDDIDFVDMASALGKIARFNGICRGPAYSVAQHCVLGADALFAETGDAVLAGYFVLHDGHEYRFGDWPRPSVEAVIHHAKAMAPEPIRAGIEMAIRAAIAAQKAALDRAIWQAAGLAALEHMPLYARQVRAMDERMLRFEALALFGPRAAPHLPAVDRPAPRVTVSLAKPWPAEKAREMFLDRLERYLGIVARAA